MQKLSILIPVYNEGKTIDQLLQKVVDLQLYGNVQKEIVVVNDCSKDNTDQAIKSFLTTLNGVDIRYFSQEVNKGKGAAIHRAMDEATGDHVVMQDADLELNPEDINALLKEKIDNQRLVVYGSRFLEQKHENTNFIWHIMGNGFLTKMSNLFSGQKLTDMMTCYKMLPTDLMRSLKLKEQRFGFEPEITVKLGKVKGMKIVEVPISYSARTKEEGKKISWKDGMRAIWCIVKYRVRN
ncbi:MAG: glycosyltransferase family 2 protein [Fluviicola sp.]|jgi:glycosyltransferase involved in cell wall biosynthesis